MVAWAEHAGAARTLVHRLKYEGITLVAQLVVPGLADRLPPGVGCLVPVRRTFARRVRYGVDPAAELARALSVWTGIPVCDVLRSPPWWPANAGVEGASRRPPRLRALRLPDRPLLVDDVVTTGATLDAAARLLPGTVAGVTMTGVP